MTDNAFDISMRALMDHSSNVLETSEKNRLKIGNSGPNPMVKYLNRFKKAYENTEPEIHHDYVSTVYRNHKREILKGPKNDSWLKNSSVVIQFGEELPKPPKDIKIMLSSIYTTAVRLQEETEKRVENLPDAVVEECPELNYPEIILLHLYRLFREISPQGDAPKLSDHVKEIESELGIVTNAPVASSVGGMGQVFDQMFGMLKQKGVTLPADGRPPNPDELGDIFSKVFNNKDAGELVTSLTKGVDFTKLDQCMPTILNNLKDTPAGKNMLEQIGPDIAKLAAQNQAQNIEIEAPTPIDDNAPKKEE